MIGHHEGEGENLLRLVVSGLKSRVCVCECVSVHQLHRLQALHTRSE